MTSHAAFLKNIDYFSHPFQTTEDLDVLMSFIGDARFVLLGEASHGTQEYYQWRAEITKRFIQEKQFSFLAVEGDWPDCYEINRFIKGYRNSAINVRDILSVFRRWPTWMWGNEEMIDLIGWLHEYNKNLSKEQQIGFYGLDVYSLWESLDLVINYLKKNDPKALEAALQAYHCFEPYSYDAQAYAYSTTFVDTSCEEEVVKMLATLRTQSKGYEQDKEGYFNAEQNALVVKNAENYYRIMMHGDRESWNIRDSHMTETLERLMRFHGKNAKAIVWAHNTHIGDARATTMADEETINIGQLIRERYEAEGIVLVGFGSYQGEVIAGSSWGAPWQKMPVPPARQGSWEEIFHRASPKNKLFIFDQKQPMSEDWLQRRGHRAIGVVYHPTREYGNYVPTDLPLRYDAFCYIDETNALHPLPLKLLPEELPETYPSAV